jgi:SAM-dependent methyltransferase
MSTHVEQQLQNWLRLTTELGPRTVLDVGCGRGRMLELLAERGIEACGVEASEEHVEQLVATGHNARVGSGDALPFEDDAFDVVTMRHMLHHMAEHEPALREALRVARRAVVVAEPYYETEIPSQAEGDRLDRWHKRRHDSSDGSVHRDNLRIDDLLASMQRASERNLEIEIGRYLPLRPWLPEDVERRFGPFAAALEDGDPEKALFDELLELTRAGLVTRGGSVWLRAVIQ